MKKIILTPIIALLLGLTGCSTQQVKPIPYNQKALNLKVGMTKDEVISKRALNPVAIFLI